MDARGKITITQVFSLLILLIAIIIIIRLAAITIQSDDASPGSSELLIPDIPSRIIRGSILDIHGTILAAERPNYTCALLLREIDSLETLADRLAPVLYLSPSEILERCAGKTSYAQIAADLSQDDVEAIRQVVAAEGLRGVVIDKLYGRTYPTFYHAAQTIGFTDTDNRGLEGLEYKYERLLSPLPVPGEERTQGATLRLTLDSSLQYFSDLHVQRLADDHDPDSIVSIIMEASTGRISAISSYPWYDLNDYNLSTPDERKNRAVSSMYEPGSVFKIFTLAAILEMDEAHLEEPFICDGSYEFTMPNGKTSVINCVSPHGEVGPREIIKYSCNGAIADLALQSSPEVFYQLIRDFGFSQRTGIDLPGESPGMLSHPMDWSGRSLATIAFGQEIGVTAIQMITAATVFCNDGNLLAPRIVEEIRDGDGDPIITSEPTVVRHVMSGELAKGMLDLMIAATEPGGTGVRAKAKDMSTAAKTGTAQILDPETLTYSEDHVLASCIVLVPAEDPEYIIYIAADNPKAGQFYGSSVAAPYIRNIIEDMVSAGYLENTQSRIIDLSD